MSKNNDLNLRHKTEVIITAGDKVCLCPPTRQRQYWTVPGGGIDEGETHEDSAVRECLEEVGILIKNVRSLNFSKAFMGVSRAVREGYAGSMNHFYVADWVKEDLSLFDSEADGRSYIWVTLSEARRHLGTDIFSETRLEAIYKAFALKH